MVSVGELSLELKLDFSDFDQQVRQINNRIKKIEGDDLSIKVDLSQLHDLNNLLEIKKRHLRNTINFFNSNPLSPKGDDSNVIELENKIIKQKQVNRNTQSFLNANKITPQIDTTRLENLSEELQTTKNETRNAQGFFKAHPLTTFTDTSNLDLSNKALRNQIKTLMSVTQTFSSKVIKPAVDTTQLDSAEKQLSNLTSSFSEAKRFLETEAIEIAVEIDKKTTKQETEVEKLAGDITQAIAGSAVTNLTTIAGVITEALGGVANQMTLARIEKHTRSAATTLKMTQIFGTLEKVLPVLGRMGAEQIQSKKQTILETESVGKAKQASSDVKGFKVGKDKEQVILVSAGFVGAKGEGSKDIAKELRQLSKNNVVIPVANRATDVATNAEENPVQAAQEIVAKMVELNITKGFNQDAIDMAAKAMAVRRENPDIPINLVGHSAGGMVVEEALAILKEAGVSNVRGTALGSPQLQTLETQNEALQVAKSNDLITKINKLLGVVLPSELKTDAEKVFSRKTKRGVNPVEAHRSSQYFSDEEIAKVIIQPQKKRKSGEEKVSTKQVEKPQKEQEKNTLELIVSIKELSDTMKNLSVQSTKEVNNVSPPVSATDFSLVQIDDLYTAQETIEKFQKEFKVISDSLDAMDNLSFDIDSISLEEVTSKKQTITKIKKELEESLTTLVDEGAKNSIKDFQKQLNPAEIKVKSLMVKKAIKETQNINQRFVDSYSAFKDAVSAKDINKAKYIAQGMSNATGRALKQINDLLKVLKSEDISTRFGSDVSNTLSGYKGSITKYANSRSGKQTSLIGKQLRNNFDITSEEIQNLLTPELELPSFESTGDDVVKGLVKGIEESLDQLESISKELAYVPINTVEDTLKIQSPSKVFQRIGRMIIEGLDKGIKSNNPKVAKAFDILDNLITKRVKTTQQQANASVNSPISALSLIGSPNGGIKSGMGGLVHTPLLNGSNNAKEIKQVNTELDDAKEKVSEVGNGFVVVAGAIVAAAFHFQVFSHLFSTVNQLFHSTIGLAAELGGLIESYSFVFGGTNGIFELKRISDEADRLGVSIQGARQGFLGLGASLIDEQSSDEIFSLFSGVQQYMTVLGTTKEGQESVFRAMTQMASKGKISLEELTGQLGEQLPGALRLAAESMNMTKSELIALVSAGQLASGEFLPLFGAKLGQTSELGVNPDRYSIMMTKFENKLLLLKESIGQVFVSITKGVLSFVTPALDILTKNLGLVTTAVTSLGVAFALVSLADLVINARAAVDVLSKIPLLGQSIAAIFTSIKTYGLTPVLGQLALWSKALIGVTSALVIIAGSYDTIANMNKETNESIKSQIVFLKELDEIKKKQGESGNLSGNNEMPLPESSGWWGKMADSFQVGIRKFFGESNESIRRNANKKRIDSFKTFGMVEEQDAAVKLGKELTLLNSRLTGITENIFSKKLEPVSKEYINKQKELEKNAFIVEGLKLAPSSEENTSRIAELTQRNKELTEQILGLEESLVPKGKHQLENFLKQLDEVESRVQDLRNKGYDISESVDGYIKQQRKIAETAKELLDNSLSGAKKEIVNIGRELIGINALFEEMGQKITIKVSTGRTDVIRQEIQRIIGSTESQAKQSKLAEKESLARLDAQIAKQKQLQSLLAKVPNNTQTAIQEAIMQSGKSLENISLPEIESLLQSKKIEDTPEQIQQTLQLMKDIKQANVDIATGQEQAASAQLQGLQSELALRSYNLSFIQSQIDGNKENLDRVNDIVTATKKLQAVKAGGDFLPIDIQSIKASINSLQQSIKENKILAKQMLTTATKKQIAESLGANTLASIEKGGMLSKGDAQNLLLKDNILPETKTFAESMVKVSDQSLELANKKLDLVQQELELAKRKFNIELAIIKAIKSNFDYISNNAINQVGIRLNRQIIAGKLTERQANLAQTSSDIAIAKSRTKSLTDIIQKTNASLQSFSSTTLQRLQSALGKPIAGLKNLANLLSPDVIGTGDLEIAKEKLAPLLANNPGLEAALNTLDTLLQTRTEGISALKELTDKEVARGKEIASASGSLFSELTAWRKDFFSFLRDLRESVVTLKTELDNLNLEIETVQMSIVSAKGMGLGQTGKLYDFLGMTTSRQGEINAIAARRNSLDRDQKNLRDQEAKADLLDKQIALANLINNNLVVAANAGRLTDEDVRNQIASRLPVGYTDADLTKAVSDFYQSAEAKLAELSVLRFTNPEALRDFDFTTIPFSVLSKRIADLTIDIGNLSEAKALADEQSRITRERMQAERTKLEADAQLEQIKYLNNIQKEIDTISQETVAQRLANKQLVDRLNSDFLSVNVGFEDTTAFQAVENAAIQATQKFESEIGSLNAELANIQNTFKGINLSTANNEELSKYFEKQNQLFASTIRVLPKPEQEASLRLYQEQLKYQQTLLDKFNVISNILPQIQQKQGGYVERQTRDEFNRQVSTMRDNTLQKQLNYLSKVSEALISDLGKEIMAVNQSRVELVNAVIDHEVIKQEIEKSLQSQIDSLNALLTSDRPEIQAQLNIVYADGSTGRDILINEIELTNEAIIANENYAKVLRNVQKAKEDALALKVSFANATGFGQMELLQSIVGALSSDQRLNIFEQDSLTKYNKRLEITIKYYQTLSEVIPKA